MKISRAGMLLFLGLLTMPLGLGASPKNDDFLIDPSKHYVYLKFDHMGEREPLSQDEPHKGLWLRLVNNCRIPIMVAIFDTGSDNLGVGVFDEVVSNPTKGPIVHFGLPGKAPPQTNISLQGRPPEGYSAPDFLSTTVIPPGGDLLFSVPANHVSPSWYLQVRFYFQLRGNGYGTGPYSVVSFDWQDIPEKLRKPEPVSASPTTH